MVNIAENLNDILAAQKEGKSTETIGWIG